MRLHRSTAPRISLAPRLRPPALALFEIALWAGAIAILEGAGSRTPHDGADLIGLTLAGLAALLFHHLASSGWMPATASVGRRAGGALRRLGSRVALRHAVVLRAPPLARAAAPDAALVTPIAVSLASAAALLLAGERVQGFLVAVESVSYTAYLLVLAGIWLLLASVSMLGFVSCANWVAGREAGIGAGLRLLPLVLAWALACVAVALLPGIVLVAFVLVVGAAQAIVAARRRPPTYLLCRRDAGGRLLAVTVDAYLRRLHLVFVAILFFATALGQSHRLFAPHTPRGPFALTEGLSVLAAVGAAFLVARAGGQILRLLGSGAAAPEHAIVPTVWVRRAAATGPWAEEARRRGWRVETSATPPREGWDLVVSDAADPRRFEPDVDTVGEDAQFRLERRYHVVQRRQFFRRFHSLYREITILPRAGSGFLFSPHVWLLQGIVRDADERREDKPRAALLASPYVGRPYADVFPRRVRRYIGGVLRALQVDVVYWEDGVTWRDLRAVLRVAFETFDQGRWPAEERHFVGIPRIRVVIQEEEDFADAPAPGEARETVPTLHARVLLILRDRGGEEEETTPSAPGSRRRAPVLV
jgi:hypothetical protein